jgi:hypothetical protein
LIGRVVEILPTPARTNTFISAAALPAETLTRIATGAPLRVLS